MALPPGFDESRAPAPEELADARTATPAIRTLEECVRAHHVTEIDYADASGRAMTRKIRPAFIRYSSAHHLVVWGIPMDAENWEELRLDRIRAVRDTGEEFTPSWQLAMSRCIR